MKPSSGRRGDRPRGRGPGRLRPSRELAVVYEDDAIVIVNKPAGLLSVPVPGSDAPSVQSLLAAELKFRRERAFVVHRIDRFTSGLLLFAKTQHDREALIRQFIAHTPVRQYLAVVRGVLPAMTGTLVHHLRWGKDQFQRPTRERDPEGTRAELRYSVERKLRDAAFVRVTLVTGLQNQIRVQFLAIGHPVIGDRKYAPEEAAEKKISRLALHAARLEFVHPRTGETVSAECDLAEDIASLVRALTPPRGRR
jgi:23S rRNA pseudouridine1911/1915/1917 synthase